MPSEQPQILDSARRQGVSHDDMQHVFRNPVRSFLVGDEMTMVIGADRAVRLVEVGVVERLGGSALVIAHAMPARDKFLRR